MQVLNFFSDRHRTMPVNVFVSEPFLFLDECAAAVAVQLAPGIDVRFVSLETLMSMKRISGRAKDLDDLEHLTIVASVKREGI